MNHVQILACLQQIQTTGTRLEAAHGSLPAGSVLQAVWQVVYGAAPPSHMPADQESAAATDSPEEEKTNPCTQCKEEGHLKKCCPTIIETECGCHCSRATLVDKSGKMKPHGPYNSCSNWQSTKNAERKMLAAQELAMAQITANTKKRSVSTARGTKSAARKRGRIGSSSSSSSASSSGDDAASSPNNNTPQTVVNTSINYVLGTTGDQEPRAQQQQRRPQMPAPKAVCITQHAHNTRYVCLIDAVWSDEHIGTWLSQQDAAWTRTYPFERVLQRFAIEDPRKAKAILDLYTAKEVFKSCDEGVDYDLSSVRGGQWQDLLLPEQETIAHMCRVAFLCPFCYQDNHGTHKPNCARPR